MGQTLFERIRRSLADPNLVFLAVELGGLGLGVELWSGGSTWIPGSLGVIFLVLAFVGSTGGGVIRDLLLGEHPPAALRDWRYAALAVAATGVVIAASLALGRVGDWSPPLAVDIFEAIGLALAVVAGKGGFPEGMVL